LNGPGPFLLRQWVMLRFHVLHFHLEAFEPFSQQVLNSGEYGEENEPENRHDDRHELVSYFL
jgi:hypothetical protein